ncbi:triphosphoribosyl-dephospho-CoA synthase MdcB [Paraburkholderia fungorum]|uniref:triphosphoribosyl-dephospho-CoA synthase MdcB n=1 Tax=Paraburkholderia fungorum TaxID=134537 RepID=UPI0038B6DF17
MSAPHSVHTAVPVATGDAIDAATIGRVASMCLKLEVMTYPKPGLVSHVDNGAHDDMNAALMYRSAASLAPYFSQLMHAGANGARMPELRTIGLAAERAMMAATEGINAHRGAIFGMGLLCAAAGFREVFEPAGTLGAIVAREWADGIVGGTGTGDSHGALVCRRFNLGGARKQAASGFPAIYRCALPALLEGESLRPGDAQAARVHALMRLIATVDDTNLLYRGGADALTFAREQASGFLKRGGVGQPAWRASVIAMHQAFVARRLSPGGCADLLAMTLFVRRMA